MQNRKIILIVVGLIIVAFIGFYLFSNIYPQSTSSPSNQNPTDTQSTSTQDEASEAGVAEEVTITDEGFNKETITVNKGTEFSIMNYSSNSVTLIGNKFFEEGKDINKNQGVGFPIDGLINQNIEEMEFWLKKNPSQKLKVSVSN